MERLDNTMYVIFFQWKIYKTMIKFYYFLKNYFTFEKMFLLLVSILFINARYSMFI